MTLINFIGGDFIKNLIFILQGGSEMRYRLSVKKLLHPSTIQKRNAMPCLVAGMTKHCSCS